MKTKINTLTEEIARIKDLFTEERLYGNLVEQEKIITDFDKDYDYKAADGKWQYQVKGDTAWKNINKAGADKLNAKYPDIFKGKEEKAPEGKGVTIDIEAIKKSGFPTQEEGDAFRKWVHADPARLKKVEGAIAAAGFADDNLDLTGVFDNDYIIAALELVGDEYATTLKGSDTEGKGVEGKGVEGKGVEGKGVEGEGDDNVKPEDAVEKDYYGDGDEILGKYWVYSKEGDTKKVWDKDGKYIEGLIYGPKADGTGYEFMPGEGYNFTKADGDGLAVEKTVEVWTDKFALTGKRMKEMIKKLKTNFQNDETKNREYFRECKDDLKALGVSNKRGGTLADAAKEIGQEEAELRGMVELCMSNFGDELTKDRGIRLMVQSEGINDTPSGKGMGVFLKIGEKIPIKSQDGRELGFIKKLKRANVFGVKGKGDFFFLDSDKNLVGRKKRYILKALENAGVAVTDIKKLPGGRDWKRDKFTFRTITS